jgi:carboxypeptidase Taq
MPGGGAEARSDLMATLRVLRHEMLTAPDHDDLLDLYQPDGRSAEIDRLFDALTGTLPGLLGAVLDRQAARPAPLVPDGPFPVEAQRALGVAMMEAVGLEPDRTRLDHLRRRYLDA